MLLHADAALRCHPAATHCPRNWQPRCVEGKDPDCGLPMPALGTLSVPPRLRGSRVPLAIQDGRQDGVRRDSNGRWCMRNSNLMSPGGWLSARGSPWPTRRSVNPGIRPTMCAEVSDLRNASLPRPPVNGARRPARLARGLATRSLKSKASPKRPFRSPASVDPAFGWPRANPCHRHPARRPLSYPLERNRSCNLSLLLKPQCGHGQL